MTPDGVPVHVRATFISIKWMPSPFTVGHNNLNPELKFYDDHFEIKSVKRYSISYDDITEISTLKTLGTRNVRFKIKKGMLSHTANVMDDQSFAEVLSFLAGKGLTMSSGAKKQLDKCKAA